MILNFKSVLDINLGKDYIMSVYTELGKALGSLLVGGFVGSASNDFYQSYKADCVNNHHTPLLEKIIGAIASGIYFNVEMIVSLFRFLVWIGAISLVSVVNLTKYIFSFVQKKSLK